MSLSKSLLAATAVAALMAGVANAGPAGHYHIFRPTSFKDVAGHVPPPAGDMNYYGGSVFSDVKLVSVIWNKDVLQNTKDQVPLFSAAIVDSTYVDQAGEYATEGVAAINGHKSTNQEIHRGTYLGQVQLNPHNQSKTLDDTDIQRELKLQVKEGNLPPRDPNTLYMIYFPQDIHITLDGSMSCQAFGAYHFATNDRRVDRKNNFFYAVEPECGSGFSFLTFAASHEYAEATTDNVPTPGSNPDFPQAWNDAQGFEVGDKCSGRATLTSNSGSWTVTQFYLNSLHGCSTKSTYTSP
ncbi:MAG: hypothetical protein JOY77_02285 [Alphaproteobacteria bacterium]|nr:hypothetical protein [Alphaproteobacteria bacterium]MBV9061741.1 hypothetical protein [Alphaproteobacteria bacterium]